MTTISRLVGYVRKSKKGNVLKLSIDVTAFSEANRYSTADGREYVTLVANLDKVQEILYGQREVTSLCNLSEEHQDE